MAKSFNLSALYEPAGDQPNAINQLCRGLDNGEAYQVLLGVTGSGKTFTISNVIQQVQRPAIILAHNKTLAAQLYGEMKSFFPDNRVEYFVSYYDYYQPEAYVPASDTFIEKDASINEHIEQMRLSATKSMLEKRDTIIVASVSAIYGLGDPVSYLRMILHLVEGDDCEHRALLRRLAQLQYTRNDIELQRGTYRVRGEVIDVFPAEANKTAVRIELFDDVIESLSYFDPLTGQVESKTKRLTIHPKSHYVTPREQLLKTVDYIKTELKQRLQVFSDNHKLLEAQRIEERTQYDIEMIMELGYCSGIENYSRYLSARDEGQPPPTLFDYLPADTLLIIDESHVTIPQIGGMYKGDNARKKTLVEYGFRLPSALDNRPLTFAEFENKNLQTIYMSATPGTYELAQAGAVIEQVVRPTGLLDPIVEVRPASTQVDDLLSELRPRIKKSERILVTTLTKKMAEDLTDYLHEVDIKVRYLHSDIDTIERVEILRDLRLGIFDVLIGINLLREGLDIPEVSLVAILDADKEGFLRSERALIQTIGRAARHLNGKAILYADKVTKSMQKAMYETLRRRDKQKQFNLDNNITPKGISKQVIDILDAYHYPKKTKQPHKIEENISTAHLTPAQLLIKIETMETEMFKLANDLEFEKAAKIRDEISLLQAR